MAQIIRTNNTRDTVKPSNSRTFTLQEIHDIVGGYFTYIHMSDGRLMLVNENSLRLQLPDNYIASLIVQKTIVGNVLVVEMNEMQ